MTNETIVRRVLIACERYETDETSIRTLQSSLESHFGALEGLPRELGLRFEAILNRLEQAEFLSSSKEDERQAARDAIEALRLLLADQGFPSLT